MLEEIKEFIAYRIVNMTNGKVYIGITSEGMSKRYKNHLYRASTNFDGFLYNAIRKYGKENFLVQHITSSGNFEDLLETEKTLIKQYNSFNREFGYNLTLGGDGALGRVMKPETREKLREANTGRVPTEEQRQASSIRFSGEGNPRFGKKNSLKQKIKSHESKKHPYPNPYTFLIGWNDEFHTLFEWSEILNLPLMLLTRRLYRYKWSVEECFTVKENKRDRNKKFTFQEKTLSLKGWSKETGILEDTLWKRIFKYGWTIERALTEKVPCVVYTCFGESMTATEWSKSDKCVVDYDNLKARLFKGWKIEQALTVPLREVRLLSFEGKTHTLLEWSKIKQIKLATLFYRVRAGMAIEDILRK